MSKIFSFLFLLVSYFSFSQDDYSVKNISLELLKNANSVLVNDFTEVDVSMEGKMITTSQRAVTILNKKGDRNAFTAIYYDNDYIIKNAEVFVYDAQGNLIKKYKKKDFKDVSATGSSLYKDDRALYIDYTPSAYPYTLVFNYKRESSSNAFINSWFPLNQHKVSVKKSVYKLIFNAANKPRYNTKNLDGYDIVISETPNEITFTGINMQAVKYEEHSLPFKEIMPNVSFSLTRFQLNGVKGSAKNWNEFGVWMQNSLLSDVGELPSGTITRVKNLVRNDSTNIEKARKIYQYLQGKVRYISVQIGIGGWKPMTASEVDKLGYGDCKALTNYTKALLDAVGIPSYYTIIHSGKNGANISNDFVALQGDHVILGVPDGDDIIWLECTSQETPFGFVGNFINDRDVLIITPEGGKIEHTKTHTFKDNLQQSMGSVVLDLEGSITANIEFKSEGLQYDDKYFIEKETNENIIAYFKKRWGYLNGLNIEEFKIENNEDDVIFTEKLKINASNYATKVTDNLLFCINIFNQSHYIPPKIPNRKQKLFISEGFMDTDVVDIKIPDEYKIESLPENKIIKNKFGSYSISFIQTSESQIRYARTFIIKKGIFPPEEYNNFRSFKKSVAKHDKTKIALKLKTP